MTSCVGCSETLPGDFTRMKVTSVARRELVDGAVQGNYGRRVGD